jgi:hypothetical protein
VSFLCLADPHLGGYRSFGLRRGGFLELLGPLPAMRAVEAAAKGHLIERTVGDARQMPGTFIIDRNGIIRYAHQARHVADHPDVVELVEALRGLE